MSIQGFSESIQKLQGEAGVFERWVNHTLEGIRARNFTAENIVGEHNNIREHYVRIMNTVSELKNKIAPLQQRASDNEFVQLIQITEQTSNIEYVFESNLRKLNDQLLTIYPTAKIEYGNRCISEPKTPFIDGANAQIQNVLKNASCIREIRGDGNCYASSFIALFLEWHISQKTMETLINLVISHDIDDHVLKQEVLTILMELQNYPSQKEKILSNNQKVLPLIKYFRILAAEEMKKNQAQYEPAFRNDLVYYEIGNEKEKTPNKSEDEIILICAEKIEAKSYNDLVSEYVLRMGVDFSQPSITALCNNFNFNINIIDPVRGNPNGFNVLGHELICGTLCRKGAHYFVIYSKENAPTIQPKIVIPNNIQPIFTPIQPKPIQTNNNTPSKPVEMVIRCKVPFGHALFIRGEGNGLSWNKGFPLTQFEDDQWSYEPSAQLTNGKCKILFNDEIYEKNADRQIVNGKLVNNHTPEFDLPSNLEVLDQPIAPVQVVQTPKTAAQVNITIACNVGWGNRLGICSEPNWDKAPIAFNPIDGQRWGGNVPSNRNWKFVILNNDQQVVSWEKGDNRNVNGTVSNITLVPNSIQF